MARNFAIRASELCIVTTEQTPYELLKDVMYNPIVYFIRTLGSLRLGFIHMVWKAKNLKLQKVGRFLIGNLERL